MFWFVWGLPEWLFSVSQTLGIDETGARVWKKLVIDVGIDDTGARV